MPDHAPSANCWNYRWHYRKSCGLRYESAEHPGADAGSAESVLAGRRYPPGATRDCCGFGLPSPFHPLLTTWSDTPEERDPASIGPSERWRDPDSNRGHHDFQSCDLQVFPDFAPVSPALRQTARRAAFSSGWTGRCCGHVRAGQRPRRAPSSSVMPLALTLHVQAASGPRSRASSVAWAGCG